MTIEEYIELHSAEEPEELAEINRRTQLHLVNPRMCSGHLQGRLLTLLTCLVKPRLAIELGTYSAYSTLCIAEGMDEGARLHTIEAFDELEDFISGSLASSPHGGKVSVHIGPALELIPRVAEGEMFDLAFIDADKREYPGYLQALLPRMRPGSLIIADNTLWDGHVTEPDRHDAQTEGIRRFNDLVVSDPRLFPVMLPLRDGLTLIRVC